jgi:hypothetical protein
MGDANWKAEEGAVAKMFCSSRQLMKGKKLRLAVLDLDYLISIMRGASVLEGDFEDKNDI